MKALKNQKELYSVDKRSSTRCEPKNIKKIRAKVSKKNDSYSSTEK